MQHIEFKQSKDFTVGVELELQIIEPNSRELVQKCSDLLKELGKNKNIKHEFYESCVEINSNVCNSIADLEKDLLHHVFILNEAAKKHGLKLTLAGTHPTANWSHQLVSPSKRYLNLASRIKMPIYRMLTFGIHVHVGLRNGPEAIAVNTGLMDHLPHLLALSCSSPFWVKRDSGMESYRVKIIETLPTTGLPHKLNSWGEFCDLYNVLVKAGTIESVREIWWDTRPHPDFGTVEVRICDAMPIFDDVIAVAALVQSLMAYFAKKHRAGEKIDSLPGFILRQNKWRAARYGLEGSFIADTKGNVIPTIKCIEQLLEKVRPFSKDLGSEKQLDKIFTIIERGTSSKRQRKIYEETKGTWNSVIDSLISEFEESWKLKTEVRAER